MLGLSRTVTGGLEDEAAVNHPGNAVVKCLTVGLDSWKAHKPGGDNNTTNKKNVVRICVELEIISTFSTCPSSRFRPSSRFQRPAQGRARGRDADPQGNPRGQAARREEPLR